MENLTVLIIENNHETVAIVKDKEALQKWASKELSYMPWYSQAHISDECVQFMSADDTLELDVRPIQVFE